MLLSSLLLPIIIDAVQDYIYHSIDIRCSCDSFPRIRRADEAGKAKCISAICVNVHVGACEGSKGGG